MTNYTRHNTLSIVIRILLVIFLLLLLLSIIKTCVECDAICSTDDPQVVKCDDLQCSGSNTPESRVVDLGQTSGSFLFEYATGNVLPDEIIVYDGKDSNGRVLYRDHAATGEWDDRKIVTLDYTNRWVYVEVRPDADEETWWQFKVNCPQ